MPTPLSTNSLRTPLIHAHLTPPNNAPKPSPNFKTYHWCILSSIYQLTILKQPDSSALATRL
jgi:hypothetical protein